MLLSINAVLLQYMACRQCNAVIHMYMYTTNPKGGRATSPSPTVHVHVCILKVLSISLQEMLELAKAYNKVTCTRLVCSLKALRHGPPIYAI